MTYRPRPIDTSGVNLSNELNELIERVAAINHDHWVWQRIAEGWCFGPNLDYRVKIHPDLVPYDELSDSDKEIRRKWLIETLKAIVALGYTIEKR